MPLSVGLRNCACVCSAIVYRIVEGWSILDALYFCAVSTHKDKHSQRKAPCFLLHGTACLMFVR